MTSNDILKRMEASKPIVRTGTLPKNRTSRVDLGLMGESCPPVGGNRDTQALTSNLLKFSLSSITAVDLEARSHPTALLWLVDRQAKTVCKFH